MLAKINNTVSLRKQVFKAVLLVLGFTSIVVALTEPKWNPQPQQIRRKGRDVVILLDTSRSMLAEDIKPNRLERSKIAISGSSGGPRGRPHRHHHVCRQRDREVPLDTGLCVCSDGAGGHLDREHQPGRHPDRATPSARPSTRSSTSRAREYKDLILITDGEDHDSFPVQAAQKAAKEGVRIIAIGLGDDATGSRIPITGPDGQTTFLKYQGQEVWSKLDSDTLREVAYATEGGKYLSVLPGTTMDLGRLYQDLIASAEGRELESMTMMKYDEKFQIFIGLAIVLLMSEVLISERRKVA